MTLHYISDLLPGTRFRLPFAERTGVLLSLSSCTALVRYDSGEKRAFTATKYGAAEGEQVKGVSFKTSASPVTISLRTTVEVIPTTP